MENKIVKITSDFIKLDSLLKLAGVVTTGGQGKMLIITERVLVNGEVCTMRGKKVYPGDKVSVMETEFEDFDFATGEIEFEVK